MNFCTNEFRTKIVEAGDSLCLSLYDRTEQLLIKHTLNDNNDEEYLKQLSLFKEYTWELLHNLHWKNIEYAHRDCYSLSVYLLNQYKLCKSSSYCPQTLLKEADVALLMGFGRYRQHLENQIEYITQLHEKTLYTPLVQTSITQSRPKKCRLLKLLNKTKRKNLITTIKFPALHLFYLNFMLSNTPVIIENAISNWPAFCGENSWGNLEYLNKG
jgi:hypothetical protein